MGSNSYVNNKNITKSLCLMKVVIILKYMNIQQSSHESHLVAKTRPMKTTNVPLTAISGSSTLTDEAWQGAIKQKMEIGHMNRRPRIDRYSI